VAHPQIAVFARVANGEPAPRRLIAGQPTLLSRTMHDIRYDAVHDEFTVPNPFAQAILTFRGDASGTDRPIRVIHGPHTGMVVPDRVDVDVVHDEIFVPQYDRILVFPRQANGDVAPIRVIRGPATKLRGSQTLAVDPLRDLIVADSRVDGDRTASLLIFNRTDDGDAAPRAMIRGPHTGIVRFTQMQVYAPNGWIVATQPGESASLEPEGSFVGIWSVTDDGDVPPRWAIGGPKSTLKKPRGVALVPSRKEIVVSDMRLNSVLTYAFPEVFDERGAPLVTRRR
jgi:hypothetical protein